ncbi:MAG: 50S ribosomal protein L9 [Vicinamibacterales bacterium]
MIEVILTDAVDHLGRAGDIVKVADGYARNYLLPRKLALRVTAGNKRQIEHMTKLAAQKEAEERAAAESAAAKLSKAEVVLHRRVGEKDTLYGSVTSADIADALGALGHAVDKRRIQLPEPLKQLGETMVPIRLHRDVTAQVKVTVAKEE